MARPTPEEIKDMREQAKLEEAYNKSLRMTAPAPAASTPASAPASTPKKMAEGGSASARADGIAQRGKTRGRIC